MPAGRETQTQACSESVDQPRFRDSKRSITLHQSNVVGKEGGTSRIREIWVHSLIIPVAIKGYRMKGVGLDLE